MIAGLGWVLFVCLYAIDLFYCNGVEEVYNVDEFVDVHIKYPDRLSLAQRQAIVRAHTLLGGKLRNSLVIHTETVHGKVIDTPLIHLQQNGRNEMIHSVRPMDLIQSLHGLIAIFTAALLLILSSAFP